MLLLSSLRRLRTPPRGSRAPGPGTRQPQVKPPGGVRPVRRYGPPTKEEHVRTTTATRAARPWHTAAPGGMGSRIDHRAAIADCREADGLLVNAARRVPAAAEEGRVQAA